MILLVLSRLPIETHLEEEGAAVVCEWPLRDATPNNEQKRLLLKENCCSRDVTFVTSLDAGKLLLSFGLTYLGGCKSWCTWSLAFKSPFNSSLQRKPRAAQRLKWWGWYHKMNANPFLFYHQSQFLTTQLRLEPTNKLVVDKEGVPMTLVVINCS